MGAWNKDANQQEKVQNRAFIRIIFKHKGQVSFSQIRQDTDIPSSKDRWKIWLEMRLFMINTAIPQKKIMILDNKKGCMLHPTTPMLNFIRIGLE